MLKPSVLHRTLNNVHNTWSAPMHHLCLQAPTDAVQVGLSRTTASSSAAATQSGRAAHQTFQVETYKSTGPTSAVALTASDRGLQVAATLHRQHTLLPVSCSPGTLPSRASAICSTASDRLTLTASALIEQSQDPIQHFWDMLQPPHRYNMAFPNAPCGSPATHSMRQISYSSIQSVNHLHCKCLGTAGCQQTVASSHSRHVHSAVRLRTASSSGPWGSPVTHSTTAQTSYLPIATSHSSHMHSPVTACTANGIGPTLESAYTSAAMSQSSHMHFAVRASIASGTEPSHQSAYRGVTSSCISHMQSAVRACTAAGSGSTLQSAYKSAAMSQSSHMHPAVRLCTAPSKGPSQQWGHTGAVRCSESWGRGFSTSAQQGGKRRAGPVAVAISGGVDSAVAALLLKQAGHDIFGISMRNWDESEEKGNQNCSVEQDMRDAQHICNHLNIPLHEANFIDQYWNRVFSDFVTQYSQGLTPNPDLECNRSIKFDALLEFAKKLGAETVATGHYARLLHEDGEPVKLLKGMDHNKDQSYFLASVPATALQHFMFPLGSMQKADVRALAAQEGLVSADRRSSAGLCFIGRRNFADFIAGYVEPLTARYIGISTGKKFGECPNLAAVTWGQRAPISGLPERCYVVGKDVPNKVVYVTEGRAGLDHPALLTRTALLHTPKWISGHPPAPLSRGAPLQCSFKARYRQPDESCQVALADADTPEATAVHMGSAFGSHFECSRFTSLSEGNSLQAEVQLQVRFLEPARALTPQQAFVMYDGDVCLGSALVQHPGPSLHELGK